MHIIYGKRWKCATLIKWIIERISETTRQCSKENPFGPLSEEWVRAHWKVVLTHPRRCSRKWNIESVVEYQSSVWQRDRDKKTRHFVSDKK